MSVRRRLNILSQGRIDTSDLKSFDSSTSNDFDELIKSFVTGTSQGFVLRGFEILMSGAIGGAASGLLLSVDPGAIFHINSSQSGTFYLTQAGTPAQQLNSATNSIVDGSFVPSSINYVGIEYERFLDSTTSAQVYLWNSTQNNETTKTVPRAQILRFRIKITTSAFATNVLPIATVTTDSGNNVVSITDARSNLFRLGQGGASPNPFYVYPWNNQTEGRLENPSTSSSNSVSPFRGGDKMIGTLKDWMDAMMTSIQEIKGTTYWYQAGSAGSIESLRADLGNTITTGKGSISHSDTTAGLINWDEDIFMKVVGTSLSYKILANPSTSDITLSDNQVAYINLVRGVQVAPNLIFTNSSTVVSSVGSVAWTSSLQAGDWVKLGSDSDAYYYQILTVDSLSQVTLTSVFTGTSTGASGAKAKYAFGTYQTSASPSTNRHIYVANRGSVPSGQDVWWLLLRADNTGVIPRVYVRFLGSELEQGETEEIDDGVPRQLLQYIGSPLESSRYPQYVSALNSGSVAEITDITCGDASTITSNQYFFLNSSADSRQYYVWFNKDGTGTDPWPLFSRTGIEVAITTGQTNAQVATALSNALNAIIFDDFTAAPKATPNEHVVRVTNNSAGTCTDASNFNVGAPFAISVFQQGTGTGNYQINDGDDLTLAIKKLDGAYGALIASLNDPSYDETVYIVSSGTPPDSLTGPVTTGTFITLPLNSRLSNIQQYYEVGSGALQVYLNGQYLTLNDDWAEVGSSGAPSSQIQILQQLEIGDTLEFRISAGGAGAGGGGIGVPGNPGPQGPPGLNATDPVTISTKTSSYTVLLTDHALLADCTSGVITFTLPAASTANGRIFYFKKIDSSSNNLIIQGNLVDQIDGANSFPITVQYGAVTLIGDGSQFWII